VRLRLLGTALATKRRMVTFDVAAKSWWGPG
jgi:hypothetical protein